MPIKCQRCAHWHPGRRTFLKKTGRGNAVNEEWQCPDCGYVESRSRKKTRK